MNLKDKRLWLVIIVLIILIILFFPKKCGGSIGTTEVTSTTCKCLGYSYGTIRSDRNDVMCIGICLKSIYGCKTKYYSVDYFPECFNDEDCIWLADENCKGCWKKGITHEDVGRGMCPYEMFCVCENTVCKYPSNDWIRQNEELAKERCAETYFYDKCSEIISGVLE